MKTATLVLGLLGLMSATFVANGIPYGPTIQSSNIASTSTTSLTQDLEELTQLIPIKMLLRLITRYLLNDPEFQTVVRIANSYEAFIVRMRFRSQPEIITFQNWVRSQMLQSGGSMELDESLELSIFNTSPYWANSVYGWQGFINEFISYYPLDLLKANIDAKVQQNGAFTQYWQRVKALRPVYDRVLAFPETQRLIAQLQNASVDVYQLDMFIRTQFEWFDVPQTVGPATPAVPAAPSAYGSANQAIQPGPILG